MADTAGNKLVHLAACCVSPGPLEVLIEKGANVNDINNQKQTCLHLAARLSRSETVKIILQNNFMLYRPRDRKNKSAMAYALEGGDIATVSAFMNFSNGKVKVN